MFLPALARNATNMLRAAETSRELNNNGVLISFLRRWTVVARASNCCVDARETTKVTFAGSCFSKYLASWVVPPGTFVFATLSS
jgi:hypothetical protein